MISPVFFKQSISTHTPLARRDRSTLQRRDRAPQISTHTPLARRDADMNMAIIEAIKVFLLTRLLRGVTRIRSSSRPSL